MKTRLRELCVIAVMILSGFMAFAFAGEILLWTVGLHHIGPVDALIRLVIWLIPGVLSVQWLGVWSRRTQLATEAIIKESTKNG